MTSRTRSSMTTRAWPTWSCTATSALGLSRRSSTRALDWFAAQGIDVKRLMSDNAWSYTRNRSLRELLIAREIKHLRTKPYRPQTNGKVERFHQTMAREWAYGLSYHSHHHRNQALPHWLEHYG